VITSFSKINEDGPTISAPNAPVGKSKQTKHSISTHFSLSTLVHKIYKYVVIWDKLKLKATFIDLQNSDEKNNNNNVQANLYFLLI